MARSEDATKNGKSIADETTPLLVASEAGPTAPSDEEAPVYENNRSSEEHDKQLPKLQIALLCYARLVEPIAFFSIFPFINKMIEETGNLDEADVGFYGGLIVCYDLVLFFRGII
jgi:hypothetical protein